MTIYLVSAFMNCYLPLFLLALTALVVVVTAGQARKLVYQVANDIIQLRGLWQAQSNGQILAKLQQDSLALDLHHKGRMLDVEADKAKMPIQRARLELLELAEVEYGEV